jgi:predicted nuclease of predicted toxin-antitoxin system
MKLLFDANLSHKLVALLADVFPESLHVRMLGLKTQVDTAIWEYARHSGFTIVTLDSDFYELIWRPGAIEC